MKTENIYPRPNYLFNHYKLCSIHDVKAIFVSDRPRIKDNMHPNGLCFSYFPGQIGEVPQQTVRLKSLYQREYRLTGPDRYDFDHWARNGILMMNSRLTSPHPDRNSRYAITDMIEENPWWYLTYQTLNVLDDNLPDQIPVIFFGYYTNRVFKRFVKNNPTMHVYNPVHSLWRDNPFRFIDEFRDSKGLNPINWRLPYDRRK